ncbi:unnamed protein product [Phyllotreta striolata]|uniref:Uncharacterized protein n=1 Tax=Phyllotreta striolata TaxID=444603 RepID=A0A9N9XWP4_PHYSR|nr:unnamed protein product [Phyllotreta striolata]
MIYESSKNLIIIMNKSVLMLFFGVYFFECFYAFSLNHSGFVGDPAPGRSPGPPVLRGNSSSNCRFEGTVEQHVRGAVNFTVSHSLFETDILVPGVTYQVTVENNGASSLNYAISSSIDGIPSGVFSIIQDCGPHVFSSKLSSQSRNTVNWTFHVDKDIDKSNATFQLDYVTNEGPIVYRLIYVLPLAQGCQLGLIEEEAVVTNDDLPHTADCQIWFPLRHSGGHGLVVELTRLNVPCSRGYVHFSGMNTTRRSRIDNSLTRAKTHKQTQLCGKLEELPESDRFVYFPASGSPAAPSASRMRPAMHLRGNPIFSVRYRLVDYCYNVTFLARNGSFELKPQDELQCTFRIHLPYGNRVALKLRIGDEEATESVETDLNLRDAGSKEDCDGLLLEIQDGSAFWTHCTKNGDIQRHIEIVSRENKLVLNVRIKSSKKARLGLRLVYHANAVDNIVGMCDFGWVTVRQFCVGVLEGAKLPWSQAEMECKRQGGHLVSIRSDRDHHIIDNLIINSPGYRDHNAYWIGASDKTHEGDFKWSDEFLFSYTNWFPGWAQHNYYNKQPNDDGLSDQDCVEIRRYYPLPTSDARLANNFMWNDRDCSTPNYFICERLQIDERYGEWSPNCNKTITLSRDQPKATVSSPGFPRQYPDNSNCDVEIVASPGYKIILDFEELVLENEPTCSYDYLQILEVPRNESAAQSAIDPDSNRRLCGDWSSKLKLLRYVSRSSRLKLRFISDYSHHFGGFKIRLSIENVFQCADDRFFMFNNSCYLIVSYPEVNWNTSQQICRGMRSDLASVLSVEEERFITSSIRKSPEYRTSAIYWLGAMSSSSSNFSWIDGSPMMYQSWIPGLAPSDNDVLKHAEEMTCLSLQWMPTPGHTLRSGLYWKVYRCEAIGGYVCKRRHQTSSSVNYNQTINGTEGSLTSPNYPNNYYHNLDYSIRIVGPEKTRLIIKFINIHIESQLECLYDYVQLKSLYRNNATVIDDSMVLCGNHDKDMDKFNFVSETNEVQLKFHSDYSISDQGFSLIWYAVDVSACPMQTLTAKEGSFITPNYPDFLLAHLDCTITILAPSARRIWLDFHREENDFAFEDFSLDIKLGKRTATHRAFEIDGLLTEGSYVSTDDKMKLQLHTGDHPMGLGFRASYKITNTVQEEKVIVLNNRTSGILLHINYPDEPPSNVDFLQHFVAPFGNVILLELYNMRIADVDCSDSTSYVEISDSYSDANGTTWKLCYDRETEFAASTPIYISSYLNTLHLRQMHGVKGILLNGTLKVQYDSNYRVKLRNYKERKVESCLPNPCQNGGKCLERNSTKYCQCIGYYTGLFCALTKCELEPCTFGTCELTDTSYKCNCKAGYSGVTCDQKRRPCEGNPCESRGICMEKGDTFYCQCHAWWEGQRCEKRMLHIPYKPLSERMLHEPFWLGLMTVFVVMAVIGLVWCAKRHFPEKIEKLLAEEDSRNRSTVSSLRSSSVREQLAAASASASGATSASGQASGPSTRSIFGRLGIRKPSILSLTSPHATTGYEAATARTFSLDDLLKPPRRTPSPKKKRNNSTPTKKNIADKRQILQQLVSPKPNSKKVSLGELIQLSELRPNDEGKPTPKKKLIEDAAQTALIDPKLEKKVTFARLLNKVSAEMSSGSEVELGIMQTNRMGCLFARPASTPPSPTVDTRSPNSMSSNQDLLMNRRHSRLPNGRQKPASAESILAMFRNFSSTNCTSSLKVTPSSTPTASSPQDDIAGDDDSSTSSIHTPVSFSSGVLESPVVQHNVQSTIEVSVVDPMNAHKSHAGGSNLLHPPTILLEIPSTINKCLSPIREMPTPLPSPMPSPALTPIVSRRSNVSSSLDEAELSDDRLSIEIPNMSMSTDVEDEEIHCPDIAIDLQAEDGLILEEAAALQQSLYRSKVRPPPVGQSQDRNKPAITITIEPPPLVIPTLTLQTPSPTQPKLLSQTFPGSPPPHRASVPNAQYFQFPSPKQSRKMLKNFDKPTSLDLPCTPPMITITCNMSEIESDTESISPAIKSSAGLEATSSGMTYLSPFSIQNTASESNLSSSGYSSMASPGPSRCSSNNPLCPNEIDENGIFHRRQSLTPVLKSNAANADSPQQGRGRSDSETLSDDLHVESNDEGIGTDHIDEKIDEGELKSAKELEVFMVTEGDFAKLKDIPENIEDTLDRLLPPVNVFNKNSLQLPSIVVQCDSPGCDKHLSPMSSRSESPLSDRTAGMGRFSPQFYGKNKDVLPFTDSDGLYDFPSSDKVNVTTNTHHKKCGRKREKKTTRNCKTPSPTKAACPYLDIPNKDLYKVPPPRKLSPKRRITRSQVVSSSSSSDSIVSTAKEVKLSSSSPSPDTIRWSSPVAWIGEKYSKTGKQLYQEIQPTESIPLAQSPDFSKVHYGSHQKFSKLRAISHQIRFLRRLEQSLKRRERAVSPSDSFDSDDESPRATSPLLQPTKSAKPEIKKSSSIGRLQGLNNEARKGLSRSRNDLALRNDQSSSLKAVLTE